MVFERIWLKDCMRGTLDVGRLDTLAASLLLRVFWYSARVVSFIFLLSSKETSQEAMVRDWNKLIFHHSQLIKTTQTFEIFFQSKVLLCSSQGT